jgi:hypothetical protein
LNKFRPGCYDAVLQIEQIVALQGFERRRPPRKAAATHAAAAPATIEPKKRGMSAAGRKAIADAVRRRWTAVKAGKAPSPSAKKQRKP